MVLTDIDMINENFISGVIIYLQNFTCFSLQHMLLLFACFPLICGMYGTQFLSGNIPASADFYLFLMSVNFGAGFHLLVYVCLFY